MKNAFSIQNSFVNKFFRSDIFISFAKMVLTIYIFSNKLLLLYRIKFPETPFVFFHAILDNTTFATIIPMAFSPVFSALFLDKSCFVKPVFIVFSYYLFCSFLCLFFSNSSTPLYPSWHWLLDFVPFKHYRYEVYIFSQYNSLFSMSKHLLFQKYI